jgi:hypothetical protein
MAYLELPDKNSNILQTFIKEKHIEVVAEIKKSEKKV